MSILLPIYRRIRYHWPVRAFTRLAVITNCCACAPSFPFLFICLSISVLFFEVFELLLFFSNQLFVSWNLIDISMLKRRIFQMYESRDVNQQTACRASPKRNSSKICNSDTRKLRNTVSQKFIYTFDKVWTNMQWLFTCSNFNSFPTFLLVIQCRRECGWKGERKK